MKIILLLFSFLLFTLGQIKAQTEILHEVALQEVDVTQQLNTPRITPHCVTVAPNYLLNGVVSSLDEVLQHIPSLDSDMEGNIRLRGSEKVTILINGAPSPLMGSYRSEVLIQLPAALIAAIEVTTQPTASQIGDGGAGIVNIILHSKTTPPTTSSSLFPLKLTVAGALEDRYMATFAVQYRRQQWDCYASLGFKQDYRYRKFDNTIVDKTKNTIQTQDNNALARPRSWLLNGGVNYNITPRQQIGIELIYYDLSMLRMGNIKNQVEKSAPQKIVAQAQITRQNRQINRVAGANFRYHLTWQEGKYNLNARLGLQSSLYDEENNYTRHNLIAAKIMLDSLQKEQNNLQQDLSVDGSILHPFWGKWGVGIYQKVTKDNFQITRSKIGATPYAGQYFETIRLLFAPYIEWSKSIDSWDFMAGLRVENTMQTAQMSDSVFSPHYQTYLLPTLGVRYTLPWKHSLELIANYRLNRPTEAQINPNRFSEDGANYTQGNYLLKAERVGNLSLLYAFPKNITASLFLRNTQQVIAQRIDPQNTSLLYWDNLYRSTEYGCEFSVFWRPIKQIDFFFTPTLLRYSIAETAVAKASAATSILLQTVITARPIHSTSLQLSAFYDSKRITPMGTLNHRYKIDFAIKQNLYKDKLALSLSVTDLFNGIGEVTTYTTPNLEKITRKQRDPQIIWATISYNL